MAGLEQQKQPFTSMLNWQKVNVLLSLTCILSSFCIPCFSVHAEIQYIIFEASQLLNFKDHPRS